MKNQRVIANSLLWAIAIVSAALVRAPDLLTTTLLPALAVSFFLINGDERSARCQKAASHD